MALGAALLYQVLVWFVWYPVAGYDDVMLLIAQLGFALFAIVLLVVSRLETGRIGLGGTHGLLPAITEMPVLGLLFMLSVVAIAWWLGRRGESPRAVAISV